jgi:hypothetical protein
MRVRVVRPYARPYPDPITVRAGARVVPDFGRETDIEGWVWCIGGDGRGGWTPRAWLSQEDGVWRIDRDFNAIELTIAPGELLDVLEEESGFYRVARAGGETGWVPVDCVLAE